MPGSCRLRYDLRFLDEDTWPLPPFVDSVLLPNLGPGGGGGEGGGGEVVVPSDGRCPGTDGATAEELRTVRQVGFYLDRVAQSAVGACGICANVVAAHVLSDSRRLRSSGFNCLLSGLLAVHTLYIADALALEVYKEFQGSLLFEHAFSNFLYPCKPLLLYASTLITVLMARSGKTNNPSIFMHFFSEFL